MASKEESVQIDLEAAGITVLTLRTLLNLNTGVEIYGISAQYWKMYSYRMASVSKYIL